MESKINQPLSQIEITDKIKKAASEIQGNGLEFIRNVVKFLETKLEYRELTPENKAHEREIRWKRTASQILEDGYVYKPKSCTDLAVTFQGLCGTKSYPTRFVKLKGVSSPKIHSMAEVEINGEWYLVDVGGRGGIRKGRFQDDEEYLGWKLWKRGEDSWDVGLDSIDRSSIIT